MWEHEHGPKGGDEINRLQPGLNYGWPVTTFGVDYSGELVSKQQVAKGIERPVLVSVPSIAPSGFTLYLGTTFPEWTGDFFVGALAERSLHRVRMREGEVALQETDAAMHEARIRDVRTGPEGCSDICSFDDADGLDPAAPAGRFGFSEAVVILRGRHPERSSS